MEITSEEMEVLNRATEILSRYVHEGGVKRETFDLFESMIESAIDAATQDSGTVHRSVDMLPFSKLVLCYMVGYYDSDDEPCFFTDANFVNVAIESDHLTFASYSSELDKKLASLSDFTFSYILLTEKAGEISILMETADDLKAAANIHAPYLNSWPIVLECKLEGHDDSFFKQYTAKIVGINVSKSTIDLNGYVDIVRAWGKSTWKAF